MDAGTPKPEVDAGAPTVDAGTPLKCTREEDHYLDDLIGNCMYLNTDVPPSKAGEWCTCRSHFWAERYTCAEMKAGAGTPEEVAEMQATCPKPASEVAP